MAARKQSRSPVPAQVVTMPEPENKLATIDPQRLIESAIEKGASIETVERMVALAKDIRAEQAKSAYYDAMSDFIRQCPAIPKSAKARINTRSGGGYSYSYAPLDKIMEIIGPIMGKLGLSASYRIQQEPGIVTAICRITHELGHFEESGPVTMPIVVSRRDDGTSYGANEAQCVGIAISYARRYALLAITGLAPQGDDSDAGEPKQEVQQPRRASETKTAPKPAVESKGTISGKIASIREGKTTKGAPFLAIKLQGLDQEFGTFDKEQFANLRTVHANGEKIAMDYEEKNGHRRIVDWWMDVSEEGEDAIPE